MLKDNRNVVAVLAIVVVIAILSACGGGNPTSGSTTVVTSTETPLALIGTKNAGGITYTGGNGSMLETSDVDMNKDGVPDRVATDILKQYPGTDVASKAKVDALMSQSRLHTSILAVTYDKLPKTKAEAMLIVYPEAAFSAYCQFDKAFSLVEFEEASHLIFFSDYNSAAKVQRLRELEKLAGYYGPGTDLSRDCK